MIKKSFIVLMGLLLLMSGASIAREVQKVGTTSLQTLKISSSVRAIGMGDAYCAVADDIQSIFWNPAGLIYLDGMSAVFTHVNMPADIQFNTAAFAKRWDRFNVFGVHFLALSTDDMPVRTIFRPDGTGENFIAYDIIGGVSWARKISDRFFFGANLRVFTTGIDDVTYTGVLGDIGTIYQTDLRTLRIGFSVQNFGPDVDYDGSYYDYLDQGRRNRENPQTDDYTNSPPPMIYRLGMSAKLFEMTGLTAPAGWDGLMAIEMSHPNDNRERINFGIELTYLDMISLRGGHKLRWKNQFGYDEERWSGGFGLKIPLPGDRNLMLDYAYMGFGKIADADDSFMASPHRFSIGVNF